MTKLDKNQTDAVPRDKDRLAAADWCELVESEDATSEDHANFQKWLEDDPRHHAAFLETINLVADASQLRHLKNLDRPAFRTPTLLERYCLEWTTRWRHLWRSRTISVPVALAGLTLSLVGAGWLILSPFSESPGHFETQVAEIRAVELADGSHVTLGPRSRLEIDFSDTARRVVLTHGEAFFRVVKDPSYRSFHVIVEDTEIRVVGTQFNVHHGALATTVAVAEGKVEITKPILRPEYGQEPLRVEPARLEAGEKVVVSHSGQIDPVEAIPVDRPGAWIEGRLYYEHSPLRVVIADANRYSQKRIVIGSAELAELPIYATFSTNNIDAMLRILTEMFPIAVDRERERIVLKTKSD